MIVQIHGILDTLEPDRALVRVDNGLTYEVLLPAYTAARLAGNQGQPVTLYTLHYLESSSQGATIYPRLAGFLTPTDRQFFELFVTCKGIGHRKALRAMSLSTHQIAAAVADRDLALLQSLPEIGKRTAETIAVTLKGKVDRFLEAVPTGRTVSDASVETLSSGAGTLARDALHVLLQLGENRAQAVNWIDRALSGDDPPNDVETLVTEVYRIKSGG
ncbi:MAG: helix-hairpin-helix domain-containing protein [Phycisphaeraceae bacterium]